MAAFWGGTLVGGVAEASAQVLGERAEMDRLETRAEELIANGDADGAAMSIGKAALMASQLAKGQDDPAQTTLLRGAEALFRAEEHAYRALALFQRAGGRPPASSGVCGTLNLAKLRLQEAGPLLAEGGGASATDTGPAPLAQRLQQVATEWAATIKGLGSDFQCP